VDATTPPTPGADRAEPAGPAAPFARRLIGVGVGPGDPELITVKAVRALEAADAILVPATEESGDGPGRVAPSGSCRRPARRPRPDRPRPVLHGRQVGSLRPRRKQAWLTSAQAAIDAFVDGAATVAFATVGDPSVYSTFSYLAAHVVERVARRGGRGDPGHHGDAGAGRGEPHPAGRGHRGARAGPGDRGVGRPREALAEADTTVAYKGGAAPPEVAELRRGEGADAGDRASTSRCPKSASSALGPGRRTRPRRTSPPSSPRPRAAATTGGRL
jgi:precorrin-2/cobalt-factor-2 C20-methyltransferase